MGRPGKPSDRPVPAPGPVPVPRQHGRYQLCPEPEPGQEPISTLYRLQFYRSPGKHPDHRPDREKPYNLSSRTPGLSKRVQGTTITAKNYLHH